jgi:hypothetical protein
MLKFRALTDWSIINKKNISTRIRGLNIFQILIDINIE